MSVCVFFLSKSRGKRAIHSYTNFKNTTVFVVFGTCWSKTRCLSAKLDTLTSKNSGRFQKMLYFCLSQNRFFVVFYGQKHIHSYTNFDLSSVFFPFSKAISNCRECMSVCVYFGHKTRQKHIHSYTHGNSRHTHTKS